MQRRASLRSLAPLFLHQGSGGTLIVTARLVDASLLSSSPSLRSRSLVTNAACMAAVGSAARCCCMAASRVNGSCLCESLHAGSW